MVNAYFQWNTNLVTGISSIDRQHQNLIEIINNVLQLCFNNKRIDIDNIAEIYNSLSTYVDEHFATEAQLMIQFKVDSRHQEEHIRLHKEFNQSIKSLFSDHSILMEPEKLGDIAEFLIRWLAYHILSTDKSLTRQINLIQKEGISPEVAYDTESEFIESSSEPLLIALRALFYLVTEKNNDLSKANADLEEKVRMRTIELLEANKRLEQYSMHDELTGLPNRRYAIGEIDQLLNNWKRYGKVFSLLYIDVDKFKAVNDNYGHEYGDKVLKWIAVFLRAHLRNTDIPCRLGGDEFLVICSHCDAESAMKLSLKLNAASKEYALEELSNCWKPSLSIGVAEIDTTCDTVNDILKKADRGMYLSKSHGGNLVSLAENG